MAQVGAPPLDVTRLRADFPILSQTTRSGHPLVYLDKLDTGIEHDLDVPAGPENRVAEHFAQGAVLRLRRLHRYRSRRDAQDAPHGVVQIPAVRA